MGPLSRRDVLVLAGALLLAALLRLPTLDTRSLWLDEVITYASISGSFGDVLQRFADIAGPPLYPVLGWLWAQVAGTGEVGMRLLPAAAGLATVPVAWACGRRVGGPRAAGFAAVLAAASPLLTWHAQDARAYALLILLTGVALLAMLHVVERPTGRWLGVWAAAAVLGLLAHYDAVFVLTAQAVVIVAVLWRDPALRRRIVVAVGAIVVVGLALLPLALEQQERTGGGNKGGTALPERVAQLGGHFVSGYQPDPQLPVVGLGGLLLLAALVVAARAPWPALRTGAALPAFVGLGGLALALMAALVGIDHFTTRYQTAAWLPLFVALAAALAAVPRRGLAAGAVAALAVYGIGVTSTTAGNSKFDHEDWRAAAAQIDEPEALAVWPSLGALPYYERALRRANWRARSVRTTRLDVAVLPPRFRVTGRDAVVPRVDAPAELVPGLRLRGREGGDEHLVLHYVADRPVTVRREDLDQLLRRADLIPLERTTGRWSLVRRPPG